MLVPEESLAQVRERLSRPIAGPARRSPVKLEEEQQQTSDSDILPDAEEEEEEEQQKDLASLKKRGRESKVSQSWCPESKVRKSPVWKHFVKCPTVANVSICLACGARVKRTTGTTTNMMNHLRRHHDWRPEEDTASAAAAEPHVEDVHVLWDKFIILEG